MQVETTGADVFARRLRTASAFRDGKIHPRDIDFAGGFSMDMVTARF
jgi:hypothetical protein